MCTNSEQRMWYMTLGVAASVLLLLASAAGLRPVLNLDPTGGFLASLVSHIPCAYGCTNNIYICMNRLNEDLKGGDVETEA